MMRLVVYLLGIAAAAAGFSWLADQPGKLSIELPGQTVTTSVFAATVMLALAIAAGVFLWSVVRAIWTSPSRVGRHFVRRREKRGLEALSSGLIAAGAGDAALAHRYALLARKSLPHEPLTQLLRAQAAQLAGDRPTARRIYEAMLSAPETEQLGLRGLYLEAQSEGVNEAALQYAQRAAKSNPKLGWSSDALFDLQCKNKDWAGALHALSAAKRTNQIPKAEADRKRAVLLTAQALDAEENETEKALTLAMEAHALAPDLVPAAAVAGRIFASKGQTGKAAKVLQKTWVKAPHPDLATAYAHARVGDSTRDRLARVQQLAALNPHSIESPIAVATTAMEARLFDDARQALEPLLTTRLTQRVATLMAAIEASDGGDKGRVREWLARAATAPRDPMWMADGVVSDHWEATSPVTGRLDAFQWGVPVDARSSARAEIMANRLEELLALSAVAPASTSAAEAASPPLRADEADVIDAEPVTVPVKAPAAAAAPAAEVMDAPEAAGPESRAARASGREAVVEVKGRTTAAVVPGPATPSAHASALGATRSTATADPLVHAPDDPGPEGSDEDVLAPITRPSYRVAR